mmetsp:Transcript_32899/g.45917  ORF Transcript_32899/g.45917 Transcript_32899/m.45917 type:complete len:141 (-) Transcript_32899:130-552(-)
MIVVVLLGGTQCYCPPSLPLSLPPLLFLILSCCSLKIQVCHCINKTQAVCMFRICLDTAFIQEGVKRIDTGDAEISKKHDHRFDEDWYVDLIFKSTTADDANGIKDQKAAAAVAAAAASKRMAEWGGGEGASKPGTRRGG